MKNRHLAFGDFTSYRKKYFYDIGDEKRPLRNTKPKIFVTLFNKCTYLKLSD